jgi:hypothetical protein
LISDAIDCFHDAFDIFFLLYFLSLRFFSSLTGFSAAVFRIFHYSFQADSFIFSVSSSFFISPGWHFRCYCRLPS